MMDKLIQAMGWMLVHSLWQGAVLALLAALILSLSRRAGPVFHYHVLLSSIFGFILVCAATYILYWRVSGQNYSGTTTIPVIDQLYKTNNSPFVGSGIGSFITDNTPLLVLGWVLFFCYGVVKNLGGWLYTRRICRQEIYSAPPEWQERFNRLAIQMNIKCRVRLLESGKTLFPVTLGFLKPVVLMPLGILYTMPPEQVEYVLRHELAHIRRQDYLVNLFQLIAESVFFFNPGLLWLSAQLREQREFCCDDITVAGSENKAEFLSALIYFKSMTVKKLPATIGLVEKPSQLRKRVIRILDGHTKTRPFNMSALLYTSLSVVLLFSLIYMIDRPGNTGTVAHKSITLPIPTVLTAPEKVRSILPADTIKKSITKTKTLQKPREEYIPMDSTILSMLTGEFNTTYKDAHYIIGVAKSQMTYLTVNGEAVAPDQWYRYANAFAAIVNQFKTQTVYR